VSTASAAVLVLFALVAPLAPWRRPSWRRPAAGVALEVLAVAVAVGAALWLGHGRADRLAGRILAVVAAYWYALVGGVGAVRLVLAMVPVTEQAGAGGIVVSRAEQSRGRIIGVLERAIALTLVLLGQYGALGLVVAAKALARFRGLEERDFAEYFLIGTLASLLVALGAGVGVTLLLR
jgi:hypothetical protein